MVDCPPESLSLEDNVATLGRVCDVCSNPEFYLSEGLYYCSLCSTQSQDMRHYVEEQAFLPGGGMTVKHSVLKEVKLGKRIRYRDKRITLSSWEIHNLVIKNMVDRLIELGFPETLRAKVFQIWSFYLLKREALFVKNSQTVNTDPRVTLQEPKMNLVALHGYKNKPRNAKRGRERDDTQVVETTDEFTSVSQSKKKKSMAKRKAVEAEYRLREDGLTNEGTAPMSQKDIECQEIKEHNQNIKHSLTYATKKTRAILTALGHTPIEFDTDALNKMRPPGFARASAILKVERFTLKGTFILLFVALRQIGCKVVFTDLMRMLRDGTLYVQSLKLLLEEEEFLQINGNSNKFITTLYRFDNATRCSNDIKDFVQYVGLKQFRYPTFEEILPKFIDEMRLPKELECFIIQMNRMFSVKDNMEDLRALANLWIPMMEVWVLAIIGVAMKILFNLDDVTEKYQSDFAEAVNNAYIKQLQRENKSSRRKDKHYALLFVLKDWFKEMEVRDHITSHETFNAQMYQPDHVLNLRALNKLTERFGGSKLLRKGTVLRAKSLAVSMLERLQSQEMTPTETESQMEENNLEGISSFEDYLTIPLPKQTVMDEFMKRGPNVAYPDHKQSSMNTSFKTHRIDYIFHPERYLELLNSEGYQVKIFPGNATMYQDKIQKDDKTLVTFKPHKNFDDFVGSESQCSDSLRRIINLFSDIAIGADKAKGNRPLFQMLMETIGDLNCRRCLAGFVPLNNYVKILPSVKEKNLFDPTNKYSWVTEMKYSDESADKV